MLNQVILVGRLVKDPELKQLDDGRVVTTITLAVQRNYKNAETGEYDTDFIYCTLWAGIAENTVEYCLQKFSDDSLMKILKKRMSDDELEELFDLISKILKKYLTEDEYHRYYLKEDKPNANT